VDSTALSSVSGLNRVARDTQVEFHAPSISKEAACFFFAFVGVNVDPHLVGKRSRERVHDRNWRDQVPTVVANAAHVAVAGDAYIK
ncbi:MAG: hypothetical protein WA419_15205, partial [Silvibacterium sp.]